MSTALRSSASAAGLTFGVAALDGGRLLGAVTSGAPAARPVVVLLDASGSLVGPPLASARAAVDRLSATLSGRPLAVVAATAGGPSLLRAFGPGPVDLPATRVLPAGRADLVRAAALVRAEARRGAGGVGAIDLVVVSDLALAGDDADALRALERDGARLHLVLAGGPRPARPDLEPAARLGDGDAVSTLLERLGASPDDHRLVVALSRLPRAWFAWRGGRLEGGAPASLARVERPVGDAALAFVLDPVEGESTLGEAWWSAVDADGGGAEPRVPLDLSRAGAVDPALVEAVRRAGGAA